VERVLIFLGYHLVGLFLRVFSPPRISGLEGVPPGGGVLFLSNHRSALDVLLIPWCIYSKFPQEVLRQAGKEELFRIPLLGWILSKWRGFPVKRGGAEISAIRRLEEFIRRDKVILYPEGTRSRDGRLRAGNRMVGRLIHSARPVVIPVAVKGTDQVIPVGKLLPRRTEAVEVAFGPPLDLSEEFAIDGSKESSERIVEKAMRAISRLLGEEVEGAAAPAAGEARR